MNGETDVTGSDGPSNSSEWPSSGRALTVSVLVTLVVTAASHLLPDDYANLAVATIFLGATWWLVLRRDTASVRAFGMSLGGWFESEPLERRRAVRALFGALAWMTALGILVFPVFILAFGKVWAPTRTFVWHLPRDWFDRLAGQVLVVALPEEAFFRGYLQSALDARWRSRFRLFDADMGPGWLVSSAIFAVGHVMTVPDPARLAVFFPALVFGWLRTRTGGIGASIAFHAACNLLSTMLAHGYGLGRH